MCENPGCLNVCLEVPTRSESFTSEMQYEREADEIEKNINVEELMNLLNLSVMDHKHQVEQLSQGKNLKACKEKDLIVEIIRTD